MKIDNGVYSVLMTPFDSEGKIDFNSYNRLLDQIKESSITGVVVLGTTSETPTLSSSEKLELVERVYKKLNGIKKIMIGIGGNNTQETLNFALSIKSYADSMLITVPHYNKPSQRGIQAHFEYVCQNEELAHIPFMLYNVPSRCGVAVSPAIVCNVYNSCQNVCAIKEASGSLDQAMAIRSLCHIQVFSGDDSLTVPIMSIGGSGVISVVGNIFPEEINEVYRLCVRNDYQEATQKYLKLHPIVKGLFIESNPVPGKELLKLNGTFERSDPRLPLVKMSDENRNIIINRFNAFVN